MALTTALDTADDLRSRLQLMVRIRWVGLAFAVLQLMTYDTLPYPAGVQEAGFAIVAGVAVANGVLARIVPRTRPARLDRLALLSVALDLLGISSLIYVFAFDPISALFALLVLVPIEAAMLFSLSGALWSWVAVAVSYLGREWYGTTLGDPWETSSVTFRLGLVGMVALIVGVMARDLQHQRQAVADALAEARQADAWRSRLVSMLAHDLRSPLAGARSGLATLRAAGPRLRPEDTRRILDGNIRQVDRMLAMTADLLDLARAQDAQLQLDLHPVSIRVVVQRALDLLGGGRDVHVAVPDDLEVIGDADRLEQVLANLLSNAWRHGAPPVEVTAVRMGPNVELAVRDHGPGLPPALRDRVFEPFATSEDGESGAGLGSWVIAHIVGLHGGTVGVEDARPGARFLVCLPVEGPPDDGPSAEGQSLDGPPSDVLTPPASSPEPTAVESRPAP